MELRRRITLTFYLAVLLIFILVPVASSSELEPPLSVAWNTKLEEPAVFSHLVIELIANDIVYTTNDNQLKAVDANDGKLLWTKDWRANLVYKDGILYAARSYTPNLYALDARTGEEIWRKDYSEFEGFLFGIFQELDFVNDTLYITINSEPFFDILAVDIHGNVKWYNTYEGRTRPYTAINSDVMLVSYTFFSNSGHKRNFIAIDLETGETIWELRNYNPRRKNIYAYRDLFLIDKINENNSFHILAVSKYTGVTIWKRQVGDSYGKILVLKDDKLYVTSENIKVLNPDTGEIINQYPIEIDADLLDTYQKAISDHIIYASARSHIYAIDLYTGELLWDSGEGGTHPNLYMDRLYLVNYGKLYSYEHGFEIPNFIFFGIFLILLLLTHLYVIKRNNNELLQKNFRFCSILIVVTYSWFLLFESQAFIYRLEPLFPSIDANWIFYLLYPSISVIAGMQASMQIKSKFLIGMISGATPDIIILIVSNFLFDIQPFILTKWLPDSLLVIFNISLAFGVVSVILNLVLPKIET